MGALAEGATAAAPHEQGEQGEQASAAEDSSSHSQVAITTSLENLQTDGQRNILDTVSHSQVAITTSLENLQTDGQRNILDTVSHIRKCGLDSILFLPQIVVCGDQSAGKSSVLEALTEIPFPRNDNLCTRFATEISLRREPISSLTIRVIPSSTRSQAEQETISAFSERITNLAELPTIMEKAMKVMGISNSDRPEGSAFAKDTLSIEIQGPDRPQLTLVDIPGLIQTSTKGVSEADVATVAEITNSYIKQPRTICLAVVAATHDAANQPILQRVREFDPNGERTLGVITKPDRLSAGSGSEAKFLELARNEDVFFKLGWHVIKNRTFEESKQSIDERHLSEKMFFSTSNFKALPKEDVGIDSLRMKLSDILLDHVKKELPRLQDDLEKALKVAKSELQLLGRSRSTVAECRAFFTQLNMDCFEICKAAISGSYEHDYFKPGADEEFSIKSQSMMARIRAVVQHANLNFSDEFRKKGHKYQINLDPLAQCPDTTETDGIKSQPVSLLKEEALRWVRRVMLRTRGTELIGNFNPQLIAELFWEQSNPWEKLAKDHVQIVSTLCAKFLEDLLSRFAPDDIKGQVWTQVRADFRHRHQAALGELDKLIRDRRDFPINYNHYYTDTVHKMRSDRWETELLKHAPEDSINLDQKTFHDLVNKANPSMQDFSCEEALDCLFAIYKVQQKTFIANVTTQVIERHLVRDLHKIFSPLKVSNAPDDSIQSLTSEAPSTTRQRLFLTDRVKKLEEGQEVFRGVIAT